MKPRIIGVIAIGVSVGLLAKVLTLPTEVFLVLDLVAGTNLSSSNPNVWQRVIANPIYFGVAMGIGFIAEFAGSYIVARKYQQQAYCLVLLALSSVATNLVLNINHPIWFNLLMMVRVLVASYLGFLYYGWQMKKVVSAENHVPPIARP